MDSEEGVEIHHYTIFLEKGNEIVHGNSPSFSRLPPEGGADLLHVRLKQRAKTKGAVASRHGFPRGRRDAAPPFKAIAVRSEWH
jgi:hypothetical protein